MSIAEQLKKVRERNTLEEKRAVIFEELRKDPDVLFYSRVEEAVEMFSIYHSKFYERMIEYFEYFTGGRSKDSRRDRLSEKENSSLSKRMKIFLEELSPYATQEPAQVILEWLIRRYRIDKYEFSHLVMCTVRIQSIQDMLYNCVKNSLVVGNTVHEVLVSQGIPKYLGKALSTSVALSGILLRPLSTIEEDENTVEFVGFLEAVAGSLFRSENIVEEVVVEWIEYLMRCRDRLIRKNPLNLLIKPLEYILIYISKNYSLIDEIQSRIDEFQEKKETEEVEDAPEIAHTFPALYAHFKRTGSSQEVSSAYPDEFVYQVLVEKEELSNWLELVSDVIFSDLIPDEKLVEIFHEKMWLVDIISLDKRWSKVIKRLPAVSILVGLEEKDLNDLFSKKFLKQISQILPNRSVERWIFRKADTVPRIKMALSVLLPVLSDSTLSHEISKADTWETALLFLTETTARIFTENIDKGLFIRCFAQYTDTVSKYLDYTPIKIDITQEEREDLLSVSMKKWEKKKLSAGEVLFIIHLHRDLNGSVRSIVEIGKKISKLPKEERTRPIKALFEILSMRSGQMQMSDLISLLELIDIFSIDTTVSVLFYKTAMSLDLTESESVIVRSVSAPETVESRMIKLLARDNCDLVSGVFRKYFACLSPENMMKAIQSPYVSLVLSGVIEVFDSLDKTVMIKIVQEAVKQSERSMPLLFESVSAHALPSVLLKAMAYNSAYSVTLLMDSVIRKISRASEDTAENRDKKDKKDTDSTEVQALLLKSLVAARKLSIYEPFILNWERTILPMQNIPVILAEALNASPEYIIKGIVNRYLKKNLSATSLLLACTDAKVSDQTVLLNILKHNPSSKSKVLLFRSLLKRPLQNRSLVLIGHILQDKKSSLIRYYVQSRLKYIVGTVLKNKEADPCLLSGIIGNLLRREKNIMHPYVDTVLDLIKKTKKKSLIKPLSKIDIKYLMESIRAPQDLVILREYVKYKIDQLEEEEISDLSAFYIENIESYSACKGLVELFRVIEDKNQKWSDILKRTDGVSVLFIHVLLRIAKYDRAGMCIGSLSCIYSRLEPLLVSSLEQKDNLAVILIMKKFFLHQKSTLISTMKILVPAIEAVTCMKYVSGLIAALFYTQSISKPSDAEEINHLILARLVKSEENTKKKLFSTLRQMYTQSPEFIGRILGQSAPYFAILLESKDEQTRNCAESLMKHIREVSGLDPYKLL